MEAYKFKYKYKISTKNRYIRVDGRENILPQILSITLENCTPRTILGIKNFLKKTGNFTGEFRKSDSSPYKVSRIKPRIKGMLFESVGIFGYANLGFSNEENNFQTGQDLIVFYEPLNGIFEVEVFKNGWRTRDAILKAITR